MFIEGFGRLCGHYSIVESPCDIGSAYRTARRVLIMAAKAWLAELMDMYEVSSVRRGSELVL